MFIQTHAGGPKGCAWVNRVLILTRTATLQTINYEALNKCKVVKIYIFEFILHMQDEENSCQAGCAQVYTPRCTTSTTLFPCSWTRYCLPPSHSIPAWSPAPHLLPSPQNWHDIVKHDTPIKKIFLICYKNKDMHCTLKKPILFIKAKLAYRKMEKPYVCSFNASSQEDTDMHKSSWSGNPVSPASQELNPVFISFLSP